MAVCSICQQDVQAGTECRSRSEAEEGGCISAPRMRTRADLVASRLTGDVHGRVVSGMVPAGSELTKAEILGN